MCLSIGGSQGGLREHLVGYTKKKNSYKLVLLCSRKKTMFQTLSVLGSLLFMSQNENQ